MMMVECTCKMQVQARMRDKDDTHSRITDAAKQEKERKLENVQNETPRKHLRSFQEVTTRGHTCITCSLIRTT